MKRAGLLISLVLLILGGCELPNYFEEYYDSDGNPINLIDGFILPSNAVPDLNQSGSGGCPEKTIDIDGTPTVVPYPNSWDMYILETPPAHTYFSFSHNSTVTLPGPPAGADVYLMEIDDLAAGAGNFFTTGAWTPEGVGLGAGGIPPDPGEYAGDGSAIYFNMSANQGIWYNIEGNLADSGIESATYSIALNVTFNAFKPYSPGTSWPIEITPAINEDIYLSDFTLLSTPDPFPFYVGAPGIVGQQYTNDGSISGFRAARTDINYDILMYLTKFDEGRPPLIDGQYTFSIWVRNEAAAASDIESITLGITSMTSDRAHFESFNAADYPGGWTDWTKITITTPIDQSMEIKDLPCSDYPAFKLTISPTYMNKILGGESILPGTLLITSPELYLVTE